MIRWGVVGPGGIATRFAEAMTLVDDGEIVAVSSRSTERAAAFAERFGIARWYGESGSVADDSEVDVVYVATPHIRHEADTIEALRAGKHVLCEKPLALNAVQAARMAAEARERGLFLMEAVWSRFLPAYRSLVDVLAQGRIGEPVALHADFSIRARKDPTHRLFDIALGGGALLDLFIYPLQLSTLVLGPVERATAEGLVGDTGVDEVVAAVVRHQAGGVAVLTSALKATGSFTARIAGTEGSIELPAFMHCPGELIVNGERIEAPFENGLQFEIAEVHRCLTEGRTESSVMPLPESIALASTLDDLRRQLGVAYPGETPLTANDGR